MEPLHIGALDIGALYKGLLFIEAKYIEIGTVDLGSLYIGTPCMEPRSPTRILGKMCYFISGNCGSGMER